MARLATPENPHHVLMATCGLTTRCSAGSGVDGVCVREDGRDAVGHDGTR